MRYPAMRGSATRRVRIPQFSGGLNRGVPAQMIDDEQISDCRNVWFKNGAIRTRDGVHTADPFVVRYGTDPDSIVALHEAKDGSTAIRTATDVCMLDEQGHLFPLGYAAGECRSAVFAEYGPNDRVIGFSGGGLLLYENTGHIYHIQHTTGLYHFSELTEEFMYAPLYFVNGRPVNMPGDASSGTTYEGFNLLTNRFRAQFTTRETDGAYFTLPVTLANNSTVKATYMGSGGVSCAFELTIDWEQRVSVSAAQTVLVNGEDMELCLKFSPHFNCLYFSRSTGDGDEDVALPFAGFSNNLEFTLERQAEKDLSIYNMTVSEWFGGTRGGVLNGTRLFLAGSTSEPNLVRYSDVNNPLYFPENNFMYVGSSDQAVTQLARQSGVLVIFKEKETYFCEYAYSTTDAEGVADGSTVDVTSDACFPITQLSVGIGCDLPHTVVLCSNRLVWATSEGEIYTITSLSNLTERSVRPISYQVREDLKHMDMTNASASLYDGWYGLLVGGNVLYMLDTSSYGFVYFTSYYNDQKASSKIVWFRWELTFPYKDASGNAATGTGQRIFRTGAGTAILAISDCCRVYEFGGDDDTLVHAASDGMAAGRSYSTVPIEAEFTTKLYDLGAEEITKHITGLFVSMANMENGSVTVTYITDHGEEEDRYTLNGRSVLGVYDPDRFSDVALSPHVMRTRYFGMRFASKTLMAIAGVVILYKLIGEVR